MVFTHSFYHNKVKGQSTHSVEHHGLWLYLLDDVHAYYVCTLDSIRKSSAVSHNIPHPGVFQFMVTQMSNGKVPYRIILVPRLPPKFCPLWFREAWSHSGVKISREEKRKISVPEGCPGF